MKISLTFWVGLIVLIIILWSQLNKSKADLTQYDKKIDSLNQVATGLKVAIFHKDELIKSYQDSAQVIKYIRDTVYIKGKERKERVKELPQDSAIALFKAATDTITIPKDVTPITFESYRVGAANSLFVQLATGKEIIKLQDLQICQLEKALVVHGEKDILQDSLYNTLGEVIVVTNQKVDTLEKALRKEKRKKWYFVAGGIVLILL